MHLEYADTACDFMDDDEDFGYSCRHFIYFDGYQYPDRSIGHALDGDSEQIAVGLMLMNPNGSSWELAAQGSRVNRASANPVHSVSPLEVRIESADLYHRRALLGGKLSPAIGYERRESSALGLDEGGVRGLLQWKMELE